MMTMITRGYATAVATVLSMLALAACGNLTAGGLTGEATVIVSGDADTLSTGAQFAALPTAGGPATAEENTGENEAEGEVEIEFLVFLVDEGGASLQLGDEAIQVKVDLRGRNEADVLDREVIPATRYTELRLVFTEISAEVQGLVIDGIPVNEVHVELEDISLLVARPIDLDVAPGASVELVVDLNSPAWLAAVDPLTGAVDETVFEDLVNVVVR
jgi:hypothetical protein